MKQEHGKEKLEELFHSMADEAKPDKGFENMLQHKLKMRFAAKYNKAARPQGRSFWSSILRFKLQVGTTLVLMIFTSTTIYAYNSDGVTNGHILYPLKRSVEKVEEIFVDSPEEKTDYYNRMAERRIRELDYLEERGEFDEETIIEADKLLSLAEIEVVNIPEETEVLYAPTTESAAKNAEPTETKETDEPDFNIKPEMAIFTDIPGDLFSKKEIALQEVRQTRNELMVRLETHMGKNPNVGQKMENLEEKFRKLDEKFDEKADKKEIKNRRKIKDIKKEEEPFIEIGIPAITADPIIKPDDPMVEAIVNSATTADKNSDVEVEAENNPPVADQPDDKNPATSEDKEINNTAETKIDNNNPATSIEKSTESNSTNLNAETIKIEDLKSFIKISPDILSKPAMIPKIKNQLIK